MTREVGAGARGVEEVSATLFTVADIPIKNS
jgi:hypothetical protein